jgi:carbon monoxide dehydrogenase subunit G
MPKDSFSHSVSLAVSTDEAWRIITDVPTLVSWVSLLSAATTVADLDHYTAVLSDKLGMFSLKADLDIRVLEYEQPRYITVRAEGEDRQVRSRIVVTARVELNDTGQGSNLIVNGTYEVSGRVATLGAGAIRTKAGKVQDEFFDHVKSTLG